MIALWTVIVALAAGSEVETKFQNVVVRRGDTLWGISRAYLKDPSRWDEILKHNRLPSSDPTVALPGMTLRVPIQLIKEDLRAAHLYMMVNRVDFRRKDTVDWNGARSNMELYKGDALRTLEDARASVKFLDAEQLNVEPNSLVIIKPPARDYDIELKAGSIFTGRSRVITASARITPKTRDTQFSTQITPDLTTKVAVHRGLAAVEAQGRSVDVPAGMGTEVKMGMAPVAPTQMPDIGNLEARAALFNGRSARPQAKIVAGAVMAADAAAREIEQASDASQLQGEVSSLRIGVPISSYRVQAALTQEFQKLAFDKVFDAEDKFDPRYEPIPPGVYWFRVALIDLLGAEGAFSQPRLFAIGMGKKSEERVDLKVSVKIATPARDNESSSTQYYKVTGVIKNDRVTVAVAGKPARQDDYGNFSVDIKLKVGVNEIPIVVSDHRGNSTTITRRVRYEPY